MERFLTFMGATALVAGALWSAAGTRGALTIQGVPLEAGQRQALDNAARAEQLSFSFDDITNWSGQGANRAALVLRWDDERQDGAMVYGYRWDGEATGADMLQAVVENNPQLYLLYQTTGLGCTLAGIGFDRYNDGNISVSYGETTYADDLGWLDIDASSSFTYTDYGQFKADDDTDMWNSGFGYAAENYGYWSYYVSTGFSDLGYSNYGASSRQLADGDVDAWRFSTSSSFGQLTAAPSVIPASVVTRFSADGLNYAVLNRDTMTAAVVASDDFSYEGAVTVPATVSCGADTYTVVEIANNAFMGCAVESVVLPATVSRVCAYAFYGSTLTSLEALGATPAALGTDVFDEDLLAAATLTVPAGCADAYKAAWPAFASVVEREQEPSQGTSQYLDFSKINVWVGQGDNRAALLLNFGDDKGMDNLVMGVRFDGAATAADILTAAADGFARLGLTDAGLTYDLNGDGTADATYDHSAASYSFMIDHSGEPVAAQASAAVATGDIVFVSAASLTGYPAYHFYVPTDAATGIWTLDSYTVNVSSKAQTFPVYINVGSGSCTAIGCTYTNDQGATDSSMAAVALANASKGNTRATITTKAMGVINVAVRARISGSYTAYTAPCRVTIAEAANKIESISYKGGDQIAINQYDVAQIASSAFTVSPSNADFTTLSLSVSDPSLFYVYSNQYYIAQKVGECDITATACDGSGVSTTVHVTVNSRPRLLPDDHFADGVFMLNEDWYGHAPGSINYFDASRSTLYPKVYEAANPDHGFGSTSQFATVFGERLYVSSKQSLIGSTVQNGMTGGGRLVVADASTMRRVTEIAEIGDAGRAVAGVAPGKVYLGMASGIRVLNVDTAADTYTLGSTIATGEVLGMEVAAGRVFALDKAGSIAVIDAATDEKLTTFGTSMLGLAQSADGNIWAAQEKKLYCYDPSTLATLREVDITSATFYSKGAGYPDNLCASPNENVLFWRDKNGNIYRFDLSDDAPATLTSVSGIYSALNYDVKSDQLIVGVGSYVMTGNSVVFINATTGETSAFEMPDYFWFTSTAVTTDKYAPEFTATSVECSVAEWNQPFTVSLADYVTDRDNNDNNITFELDGADSISSDDIATVTLQGKTLTVTPIAAGTVSARVKAVSNGRVTTQTFDLVLSGLSDGVETVVTAGRDISVDGDVVTFSGYDGSLAVVYGLSGQAVRTALVDGDRFEARFGLPAGVYFVKAGNGPAKKIIIR